MVSVWYRILAFITTDSGIQLSLSCKVRQVDALKHNTVIRFPPLTCTKYGTVHTGSASCTDLPSTLEDAQADYV